MIRIIPTMMETIAFKWASPGRFIHLERFGFIRLAIPKRIMIAPRIGRRIVVIVLSEDYFNFTAVP